jgi:hypothetical protein
LPLLIVEQFISVPFELEVTLLTVALDENIPLTFTDFVIVNGSRY